MGRDEEKGFPRRAVVVWTGGIVAGWSVEIRYSKIRETLASIANPVEWLEGTVEGDASFWMDNSRQKE